LKKEILGIIVGLANLVLGATTNVPIATILGATIFGISLALLAVRSGYRKPEARVENSFALRKFYENQRRLELLALNTPDASISKSLIKDSLIAGKEIVIQAEDLVEAQSKLKSLLFEASEYQVRLNKLVERNAPQQEIDNVNSQLSAYSSTKSISDELEERVKNLGNQFESLVNQLVNQGASEANEALNSKDRELLLEMRALVASTTEVKNWISSTNDLENERIQTSN